MTIKKRGGDLHSLPILSVEQCLNDASKDNVVLFTFHDEHEEARVRETNYQFVSLYDFLNSAPVIQYRDCFLLEKYLNDKHLKEACFVDKQYSRYRTIYENELNEEIVHMMKAGDYDAASQLLQNLYSATEGTDANGMYWDEYYDMRPGMRLIANLINRETGLNVCDLACGHAEQLKSLAAQHHVTGIDLSIDRVRSCRENGIEAYQGNAADTGMGDSMYDVVIAEELLEHVPDPEAVLREAWRILKPGGMLYITTPLGNNCNSQTHVRFFSVNSLYSILILQKFEVENIIAIPYSNINLYDNNIIAGVSKNI